MSIYNQVEPAAGQEWQDWDSRVRYSEDLARVYRIESIEGEYAHMALVRHGKRVFKPRQHTRVRLDRLRTSFLLLSKKERARDAFDELMDALEVYESTRDDPEHYASHLEAERERLKAVFAAAVREALEG